GSTRPGATIAPVGQPSMHLVHAPHPSPTAAFSTASSASVTTDPSTTHEPWPGTSTLAFLPYHPSPARTATARSTSALSSATTRATYPSSRKTDATSLSAPCSSL